MSDVRFVEVGAFTLVIRPRDRVLRVAGRGRYEVFSFDRVAEQVRLYSFLASSKGGAFYQGELAAWQRAAHEVAQLERPARAGRRVAA